MLVLFSLTVLHGVRTAPLIHNKSSDVSDEKTNPSGGSRKGKTPIGRLDDKWEGKADEMHPQQPPVKSEDDVYEPFPENTNPSTGEIGGPRGPEPTRYGDWERKGRVIDF